MSKGPGLFSDIGKKAKDLLTKDYISEQKVSVSTVTESGLAFTTSTANKGGYSSGDVATQYIYKKTSAELKVDTESNFSVTLTAPSVVPSSVLITTLKYPNYESSKIEFQHFHPHAALSAAISVNKAPPLDVSLTLGTPTFVLGAEGSYDTSSGRVSKYNAGISVVKPDSCSSIILADKGDTIKASYIHFFDQVKKTAAVGEITRKLSTNENTFTVGGSCAVDPLLLVKMKLNNHGSLGVVLQHEVIPKSLVTLSSEFDTKALEKIPRFGVSFALKP